MTPESSLPWRSDCIASTFYLTGKFCDLRYYVVSKSSFRFDDCLRVGRRISERPYILPDPEILDVTAGAIPPSRTSPQIRDATNPNPVNDGLLPTPAARLEPSRAIKAFDKKKVKLGEDLNLTDNLKSVISGLISAGGGEVTSNIDQADVYICNYRDGHDYIKASQEKKDVGNLSWLYYLITHDVWTNPMRRMMHYPRPREGVPGFKSYRISISSYTGEARVYLENLIKASGAEFTKTFKQDNTHLITAHKQSEKCEAANEWGVNVINHLWLEDSYSKCQEQPLTDTKYIHFPPRTNLGEILGHTEIDREAVEKIFFSKTRKPKSLKVAAVQQDSVSGSRLSKARVASDLGAHSSPLIEKNRRTRTIEDVATPLAKRQTEGKENETPTVPGSRGAKDRALSKLHDSAADVAKFEKEMKRKGGVIHGGRRDKDAEVDGKAKKSKGRDSTASKRSFEDVEAEDEPSSDEEVTAEPANKSKRAKKDKLTPIKYRMLLTKDERWANNPEKESKDKGRMRELGLFITDDPKKVDLLCAPKVVRTKKFVSALACGPTLVSSAFLDFALKNNKLPAPEKFPLTDQDFVKTHKIHLEEAIPRAKQNQKRLLKDWTIYCTEGLTGGSDTYQDIVEANGGKCQIWKGKGIATATASKRKIDMSDEVSQNLQEDEGDVLYLISEANKKEFGNWAKFREFAKKHDMIPRIVKTEWILHVAMAQYLHCKKEWELSEEVVNAIKK
jgi:hypothetical protein